MLIREGDRFSLAYFKDSILRIKQLGPGRPREGTRHQPQSRGPDPDRRPGERQGAPEEQHPVHGGLQRLRGDVRRLELFDRQLPGGGGDPGVHGPDREDGSRTTRFGFTEPYLFDQPITVGFNVFDRKIDYPYLYNQKSRGIDLTLGARLVGYWRANVTYSYQNINVTVPDGQRRTTTIIESMYGVGKYNISSIEPLLYRSTVDSPLTPTPGDHVFPVVQVRRLVPRGRDQPATGRGSSSPISSRSSPTMSSGSIWNTSTSSR